jgi:cyclophilin family peptidyl-prolyl cis-trans isomerase
MNARLDERSWAGRAARAVGATRIVRAAQHAAGAVRAARACAAAGLAAVLVACGGGGADTSVTVLSAANVMYGRTMTVTVSGSGLDDPDLTMIVEGPCGPVSRAANGTDLQQQFSCTVTGTGPLFPRIRSGIGTEYASLSLQVATPRVSMSITQGDRSGAVVVELDPAAAPVTVRNFLAYVNAGFYNGVIFHRVIADFVAQAGGFTAGPASKAPTRPPIVNEASNGLKNLKHTIAMARTTDPNSATAQFFFNLKDNPDLDFGSTANPAGYAVFGRVVAGQDVVDEIGRVPTRVHTATGLTNLPVTNVVIATAVQTQ